MKKIFLMLAAVLTFGIASAQTETPAKKSEHTDKSKTAKASKAKKESKVKAANANADPETTQNKINAKDDPARSNSSVANPSGMNSPATTTTSPGSTASPTGSKPQ